jgi:hypothetical protein
VITVTSNPGLVKKEFNMNYKGFRKTFTNFRICTKCNVIMDMEQDTAHCTECDVCVEGHDHHCPWTTKCIGRDNLKAFYIFVCFSFVLMGFLFFGLATSTI